ncbi:MAG TPA: hypothetical protein VG295_13330 [Solirubrobacteraceae bacterium]|jgi:hypothetical protein|nr:hypothetical protein [Solirubrobacteraceae bacterium]
METEVEIDRALAVLTATLNDQKVGHFDAARVQEIIAASLGGEPSLWVDDGGGVHARSGARVGAIHRTASGEWTCERQNDAAERSDTAIPARAPDSASAGG